MFNQTKAEFVYNNRQSPSRFSFDRLNPIDNWIPLARVEPHEELHEKRRPPSLVPGYDCFIAQARPMLRGGKIKLSLSVCLSVCLSISLSVGVCLEIYLCLSVCWCLSGYLSVFLLSVCLLPFCRSV